MKSSLFRWLYSITITICLPVLYLRLLWCSRKNPRYRERWLERLGVFTPPAKTGGVWVHAVSVGESIAVVPFIRALMKQFPDLPITVSSGTPNGYTRVEQMLKNEVFRVYFPFDLPWTLNLFLNRIQPKVCLLMETELWPNCLWSLRKRGIPVVVINGRLSDRSMKGYQRIQAVSTEMMSCLSMVAAQSQQDGARFVELGLPSSRLQVTGNVKFDLAIPPEIEAQAKSLKQQWGADRLVWIAASTHAGEEELILDVYLRLREKITDLFLILVPRHTERRDSIINLIQQRQLPMITRSSGAVCTNETAVLLGDTMGEMPLFYKTADVAFVGGSFVPVGGHNTLEPAAQSVPVAVGPQVHNFVEITAFLSKAGALLQVHDSDSLYQVMLHWLQDPEARKLAGKQGKEVVEQNRGAVDKTVRLISGYL